MHCITTRDAACVIDRSYEPRSKTPPHHRRTYTLGEQRCQQDAAVPVPRDALVRHKTVRQRQQPGVLEPTEIKLGQHTLELHESRIQRIAQHDANIVRGEAQQRDDMRGLQLGQPHGERLQRLHHGLYRVKRLPVVHVSHCM